MFCSRLNENSRQAKVSKLSLVLWLNENVRSSLSQMSIRVQPIFNEVNRDRGSRQATTKAKASIILCHETSLGDKTIPR